MLSDELRERLKQQMGIKCIHCGEPIKKYQYKLVTITRGECAEILGVDIGDSLSRDYRMHPSCADLFNVTKRITGVK